MVALQMSQGSYVQQAYPSKNFASAQYQQIKTQSGSTMLGYLLPSGVPVGPDVIVTSATLDLRAKGAWSGAATLTVRRVTSAWSQGKLTYASVAASTGTGAGSTSIGTVADKGLVSVDVTTIVQAWAAGSPMYGFRLDQSSTTAKAFYDRDTSAAALRPVLNVTAYRKPAAPTGVSPSGGSQVAVSLPTITWVPDTDPFAVQAAFRVEIASDSGFSSVTEDSGWVSSTATSYLCTVAISDGDTRYVRVSTKNGGGQASDASATATFGRTDKGTLSITSPSGSSSDSTPPIEWSLSDATQTQWRAYFVKPGTTDTVASDASGVKLDSGWRPGTDTSWTSLAAVNAQTGGTRKVVVQVRDDVNRASTASSGDSAIYEASATFTYAAGATTDATSLTAVAHDVLPLPTLAWSRASAPDQFVFWRRRVGATDWIEVGREDAAPLSTGGTGYAWTDFTATPNVAWEYAVVSNVNNVFSPSPPTAQVTVASRYQWLLDPSDEDWWIAVADADEDGLTFSEDSEVAYIAGSPRPQVSFEAMHGLEGTVSGGIYDGLPYLDDVTAEELAGRVFELRSFERQATVYRLVRARQNIGVVVRNAQVRQRPTQEICYDVSFDPVQVDSFPWL